MAQRGRDAKVEQGTDWGCPNMRLHMTPSTARIPVPCKECFSLEVITTKIKIPLDLNTIQRHRSWITWDKRL